MNHRLLKAFLAIAIVGATVVGVARWEWSSSAPKDSSPTVTLLHHATSTAQALLRSVGPAVAEAQEGVAVVSPSQIVVNEPSNVLVTIKITDTRLVAGSVNLQRIDAAGKATVIGTLNDAGTNGDAIANDKIVSILQRFQVATTTPVRLRVSWALKGVLQRSSSKDVLVTVVQRVVDANTGVSFALPSGLASIASSTGQQIAGGSTVDVKLASTIDGVPTSQFSISIDGNPTRLNLATWFQQNIDPGGSLLATGVYVSGTSSGGFATLVQQLSLPTDEQIAPVFAESPSGLTIITLSPSQTNELSLYGYTTASSRIALLLSILSTLNVP
jgi:hypothetical protein